MTKNDNWTTLGGGFGGDPELRTPATAQGFRDMGAPARNLNLTFQKQLNIRYPYGARRLARGSKDDVFQHS